VLVPSLKKIIKKIFGKGPRGQRFE